MSDRPPQALEAERSLLGAIFVHQPHLVTVLSVMQPADCYRDGHRRILETMVELDERGVAIDLVTVCATLDDRGDLEDVGGRAYVSSLIDGVPRATNVEYYARIVKDKSMLRTLLAAARRALAAGAAHDAQWLEIAETLGQDLYALTGQRRSSWVSGPDLARRMTTTIEQFIAQRGRPRGLSFGFADLDEITSGLQKGEVTIVAARPSMGKSQLSAQVAMHVAQTELVAMLSLEMSVDALALRIVVSEASVDGARLMSGYPTDRDHARVAAALGTLEASGIHIDESAQFTPLDLRTRLQQLQLRAGRPLGLVVIDYLQLLSPMPGDKRENRTNQVSGISRALKLLAREFGVPFLVLSQLNRMSEHTADKRPTLSNLRESGAIEQDADVVLLLHRPDYYDPNDDEAGTAYVIVAKNRNGRTGDVRLAWIASNLRFATLARQAGSGA